MSEPSRRAWTAELMGTTASIHVIGSPDACAAATDAAASTVAALRELEAIFSTYRADSEISRLRRVVGPGPRSRLPAHALNL